MDNRPASLATEAPGTLRMLIFKIVADLSIYYCASIDTPVMPGVNNALAPENRQVFVQLIPQRLIFM